MINETAHQYTHRAKHRLRIAARFLRQAGQRFNEGNFYDAVIRSIAQLNPSDRETLRELVDWVEEFELAMCFLPELHGRSRARKSTPQSCSKR